MAATETLKRNRTIQFNISLDEKALFRALGKKPLEEDNYVEEKEEEGASVRLLKKMREEEPPVVKLSQTPMAG